MSTISYKHPEPKKRSPLFKGAILAATGLIYFKAWVPLTGITVPCPFHAVTGWYCPGCGITRAILSLLHLDWVQAFRYNPLVFVLAPMYVAYAVTHKKGMRRFSQSLMAFMLVMSLAFGLLRNFPMFAFMAPTVLP